MLGKFIVFEGADGSGTTTQARLLLDALCDRGIPALQTFEPSDTPIGRFLREILSGKHGQLGEGPNRWGWRELSYLFMADRTWHTKTVIIPALQQGTTVICDRYYASTLVYQSVGDYDNRTCGHYPGTSRLVSLYQEISNSDGFLEPDLWFYLQVTDARYLKERLSSRSTLEIYEQDDIQQKVVDLYDTWYAMHRFCVLPNKKPLGLVQKIDGLLNKEAVAEQCLARVVKDFF